jgi:hypothetical protein
MPAGGTISGTRSPRGPSMNLVSVGLQPVVSLIAGILILLMPQLLNYIVAVYLIVIGVVGLAPGLMH